MVNCRLCDDGSGGAVVVGYRWMLMVTAKSWGPSAPLDMRLTLAPSREVASPNCSCLSIATTISTMSTKAKLTLAATSLGAIGIIIFVHHGQKVEKAVSQSIHLLVYFFVLIPQQAMHAGVIRDMEQQRIKKERQLDFDMQAELEKEYRKLQTVSDGRNPK